MSYINSNMNLYGITITSFVIIVYFMIKYMQKSLEKKAYNFNTMFLWFLFTFIYIFLVIKFRSSKFVVLLFLSLMLKTVYTPIHFSIKTAVGALGPGNNPEIYKDLSTNIFINHTVYKHNLSDIPKEPTIWLVNYPYKNFIEYYTQALFPNNFVIIINKKFGKILSKVIQKSRIILLDFNKENNYEILKDKINDIIYNQKLNVFVYYDTKVEYKGVKKDMYSLQTPRTGVLNIAKELNIKVTPIVVDHLYISNGLIPKQNFEIFVSDSKYIVDENDYKNINIFFKKHLSRMLLNKFRNIDK